MTTPTTELSVRPRGVWYLLVVALWVASTILIATVIATFVAVIQDGVTPIQSSHVVAVSDSGLTIYSKTRPETRDCLLRSGSGPAIAMNGLSYDLNATFDGTTVYAVANTPDGLDPGEYLVSCPGVFGNELYYGDRFPLGSVLIRGGFSALLGLAGLAVLIVLLVRRHTSKSRNRRQALLAGMMPGGWPVAGPYGAPSSPYGGPASTPTNGQQSPPPPPQVDGTDER